MCECDAMVVPPVFPCDCEAMAPPGFLMSGHRQDGEHWRCPACGALWVHVCDEAEGCCWELVEEGSP